MNSFVGKCKQLITLLCFSLLVACGGSSGSGFSSDVPSGGVSYKATFDAIWSTGTHPTNFPSGAHFSPIVGASHNAQVIFWENGQLASAGVKQIAETGKTTQFLNEVGSAITAGTGRHVVTGGSGFDSPGSQSITINVSEDHSIVTFLTMIAPSPDWFGGVKVDNLFVSGNFVDALTVDVLAYDAGTDSGSRYNSSNSNTSPQETIQGLITDPTDTSFTSQAARKLGTLTFVKQ